MSYATVIKSLREKRQLTQKQVAQACDITPEYLSKIENEVKLPSMTLLKKLSNVFSIPLSVINYMAIDNDEIPNDKAANYAKVKSITDKIIDYVFVDEDFTFDALMTDLDELQKVKFKRVNA